MILLIDNYDSFVYNLARHIELAGRPTKVVRNDAIGLDEIERLAPQAIILSPGPCTPSEAGLCKEIIREYSPRVPLLGVCLGHQAIGEVFGGRTVRARDPMHGKASRIAHDGTGIFNNIPSPFSAGRYHSLISDLPDRDCPLRVTATTRDRTIMAFEHEECPTYGVQFHPESILTEHGLPLLKNFFAIAQDWHKQRKVA